jgi:hypothetical protein
MLSIDEIQSKIISIADAINAQISYDMTMNVDFADFYLFDNKLKYFEEQKLNINLYATYKFQ